MKALNTETTEHLLRKCSHCTTITLFKYVSLLLLLLPFTILLIYQYVCAGFSSTPDFVLSNPQFNFDSQICHTWPYFCYLEVPRPLFRKSRGIPGVALSLLFQLKCCLEYRISVTKCSNVIVCQLN